jgi:acetyl esterase/lipase
MKMNAFRLLFLAVLLVVLGPYLGASSPDRATAAAPLSPAAQGEVKRGVTYCTPGGVGLQMDIYFPKAGSPAPAPALLFVHGGGWIAGDQGDGTLDTPELVSRGYLVAAIQYRLAPVYRFPAQIEDVKCAVRFLRANASTYGIDPGRIGAWGSSAGGHLVSLLGTTDASAGFDGNGGYPEQSSSVRAVTDMYGPSDLTTLSNDANVNRELRLVFGPPSDWPSASPVNYVSKDDVPFLILQGEKDNIVPPSQSQEFYDRLTGAGVPAQLVMVKNAGHVFVPSGGPISPSRSEITRIMADFFDSILRNPSSVGVPAALSGGKSVTFPETGKSVSGRFLEYWQQHGGLAQQGYPISDILQEKSETDGKTYFMQYFERAVFEYHPENKSPNDVLLTLLGSFRYQSKYGGAAPGQVPNTSPGSVFFGDTTGKYLGGVFLQYWQSHGGLAQQGYPISDEFQEKSDIDGKVYTVQYFERSVFEAHPENQPPYNVLLSQLGTLRYNSKYPTAP